jgi:hypothetical protein
VRAALIVLTARKAARAGGVRKPQTLGARIATGSGSLTGRQAWVQIAIIPICLAVAAIFLGLPGVLSA